MLNLDLLVKIFCLIFSAKLQSSLEGSAIMESIIQIANVQLGYNRTLARDVPINRYYWLVPTGLVNSTY